MSGWPSAIAVFGSHARGDKDGFSDKDILIVDDSAAARRSAEAITAIHGWSCTSLTWNRVDNLVQSGSLFAQHLRREAVIVKDERNRLRERLEHWKPRSRYLKDIEGALRVLTVLQGIPDCSRGRLWALDVLMVSFRAAAVARLADEGVYSFSFQSILKWAERFGLIGKSDLRQLLMLRVYKNLYRRTNGALCAPSWSEVYRLVDIVDKMFCLGMQAGTRSVARVVEQAVESRFPGAGWYAYSRQIEAAADALKEFSGRRGHELASECGTILRLVRAPQVYGWMIAAKPDVIADRLRRVASSAMM